MYVCKWICGWVWSHSVSGYIRLWWLLLWLFIIIFFNMDVWLRIWLCVKVVVVDVVVVVGVAAWVVAECVFVRDHLRTHAAVVVRVSIARRRPSLPFVPGLQIVRVPVLDGGDRLLQRVRGQPFPVWFEFCVEGGVWDTHQFNLLNFRWRGGSGRISVQAKRRKAKKGGRF